MPVKADKYKSEELVIEALELRDMHSSLKDLLHKKEYQHQSTIPTRKELITMGKVYTELKENAVRLYKAREKANKDFKPRGGKIRVVRVDAALSKFLRLNERGLPANVYPDNLVTSYFTDWAAHTGRQHGREIKLFGPNDEFVQLFGEDLKRPGSGPTIKVKDTNGKVVSETLTSVLDKNGTQINPFNMNKHMFIFLFHYPHVVVQGKKTGTSRDVLPEADNQEIYARLAAEHKLLTATIKDARHKYLDAVKRSTKLQSKKDKALQVGERSITDTIATTNDEMRASKVAYINLLFTNGFKPTI